MIYVVYNLILYPITNLKSVREDRVAVSHQISSSFYICRKLHIGTYSVSIVLSSVIIINVEETANFSNFQNLKQIVDILYFFLAERQMTFFRYSNRNKAFLRPTNYYDYRTLTMQHKENDFYKYSFRNVKFKLTRLIYV